MFVEILEVQYDWEGKPDFIKFQGSNDDYDFKVKKEKYHKKLQGIKDFFDELD